MANTSHLKCFFCATNALTKWLMRKSAYQAETLADKLLKEIALQRQQLVADVTKIGLIFLLGFTLSGALLIWLFFWFNNGA